MAERIAGLDVQAFRGVPDRMSVPCPGGRSLAVFGDNGTGKSTIADALEWYFTGRIELLSHEGRQHAIRCLSAPSNLTTSVRVETTGVLGGEVTHPEEPPARARDVGRRETFLLRGRTLADFVNKRKAEKWKALAEILGLDAVDGLRLDLQRVRNELRTAATEAVGNLRSRQAELAPKMTEVTEAGILAALRARCEEAGVEAPESLEAALEPTWAGSLTGRDEARSRAVELGTLASNARAAPPPVSDLSGLTAWNDFVASEDAADRSRLGLFQAAESLLDETPPAGRCPLCGQRVDDEALRKLVRATLETLRESSEQRELAEAGLRQVTDEVRKTDRHRGDITDGARRLGITVPPVPASVVPDVVRALEERTPVNPQVVASYQEALSKWDGQVSASLEAAGTQAPTAREGVLIEIGVLAEQARKWRAAVEAEEAARRARDLGECLLTAYQQQQHDYFDSVLGRISGRVAEIYGLLHPSEVLERVGVESWGDKGVELAVEFHGTRQKPPHGVLSESHLNSLAIALFLAMAETFNEQLGFLVLDDVVNSFDLDHRGALADLLADQFAAWQLVVLTHDHQFYERLVKRAPSWGKVEFTSWSYEEGPRTTEYQTGTMLEKAQRALADDDTHGAATKGRRALEELLQEICEGFQAPLPFRRGVQNDRRDFGELIKGVRRVLDQLAKPMYANMKPFLLSLEADVGAGLNPEAHAGRGRTSRPEIQAALGRIEEMDRIWSCDSCGTRVWSVGTPESCRCNCGDSRFPPVPPQAGSQS